MLLFNVTWGFFEIYIYILDKVVLDVNRKAHRHQVGDPRFQVIASSWKFLKSG